MSLSIKIYPHLLSTTLWLSDVQHWCSSDNTYSGKTLKQRQAKKYCPCCLKIPANMECQSNARVVLKLVHRLGRWPIITNWGWRPLLEGMPYFFRANVPKMETRTEPCLPPVSFKSLCRDSEKGAGTCPGWVQTGMVYEPAFLVGGSSPDGCVVS